MAENPLKYPIWSSCGRGKYTTLHDTPPTRHAPYTTRPLHDTTVAERHYRTWQIKNELQMLL